ncbi:MAG: hypothetical protein WCK16_04535 [Candidatus Moraniibacteriota bacterium]
MSKTTKIIRTVYLYIAALVSLIFVAVGSGTLLNTALKAYVFPKAEKGGYGRCNQQPPVYNIESAKDSTLTTEEQKEQITNALADYENWKKDNSGEECYSTERQSSIVDAITMIIIALPICLLHWRIIKKEKEDNEDKEEKTA